MGSGSVIDRQSALAGHYKPGVHGAGDGSAVTIQERCDFDLVQIAAWPDSADHVAAIIAERTGCAVPEGNGGSASAGDVRVLWNGPDRWWIVGLTGGPALSLVDAFDADAAAVSELSQSRTVLRLGGPMSRAVLAKGLPIDLHRRAFAAGRVAQSAIHHTGVLVHRIDGGNSFDLYVFRSFGLSFWEWLTDAAAEYGYTVADRG